MDIENNFFQLELARNAQYVFASRVTEKNKTRWEKFMKKFAITLALVFGLVATAVGISYTVQGAPVAKACGGSAGC